MAEIVTAGAIMAGVALFFGIVLAVANLKLKVEEDPRIDVVEEKLPGSNCGACGQPGCRAFAEALVGEKATPGMCTVNTAAGVEDIASFLGVAAGFAEKRVARLACAGGSSSVRRLAAYEGVSSCRSAHVVSAGGRSCAWGCLGLGDCQRACTFNVIAMNADDLPVVEVDGCTACGDCVDVCPLNLFSIKPLADLVLVQCASPLGGEAAMAACDVACDACGRCAADAPEGAIEMVNGLPVLRLPAMVPEQATFRCPTGAIAFVQGEQFQGRDAAAPRRRYA